jgi:hypothetical protein
MGTSLWLWSTRQGQSFSTAVGDSWWCTFDPAPAGLDIAHGYSDDGAEIAGSRLVFPAFAAGAYATPLACFKFLRALQAAYEGDDSGAIKPDTARVMLAGTDKGCREFMGVLMGVGIFVGEAGPNRFAIHQVRKDNHMTTRS